MKKFFSIIMAVLIMISASGCSAETTKNLYNPENNQIRLEAFVYSYNPLSDVEGYVQDNFKNQVNDITDNVSNVRVVENEEIENLKIKLIEFFKEFYKLDVSEKVNSAVTKLYTADPTVSGFHKTGENEVFVNEFFYNEAPENFAFTWCHEMIHLIGINYVGDEHWALIEGITEAVTLQMSKWAGVNDNSTAYYKPAMLAEQMIIANPNIVNMLIEDEEFDIAKHINEVLDDAEYPLEKVPERTEIVDQLDMYMRNMIENRIDYQIGGQFIDFLAQEITIAYCRKFNLNEEQIKLSKEKWLLSDFDELDIKIDGMYCYIG